MLLAKTAPFVRVADLQIMVGDEAALHQIAALNEALTLALLRVACRRG
jgi:hypothetical protein